MTLLFHGLEQSTATTPDKAAVVVGDRTYTYWDLERQSSIVAAYLVDTGLSPGDRVVIYMENSWQCVVALYAVSRAGGVFVIVPSQIKADKLASILNDCGAKILVSNGRLVEHFSRAIEMSPAVDRLIYVEAADHNVLIDIDAVSFGVILAAGKGQAHPVAIDRDDLAALIYTSGSSGVAKGVMQSHRSMVFVLGSLIEYLRLNRDDRFINVLPLAFDYGMYQLLMSVWLGATVILSEGFGYLSSFRVLINENKVSVFPGVPTLFSHMIALYKRAPYSLESVSRVTNTAAALPQAYIPYLQKIFPNADIYSMYGLTECKRALYLEPHLLSKYPGSVGKAIPGTEVFLLDDNQQIVPHGGEGILHIAGGHLMQGYWGDPELTRRVLFDDVIPGKKILCSGDRFYMNEEGFLFYLGRSDDMIKSRGEKVSPREIEDALCRIEGVRDAAVIGVPDEVLGAAITAYVSLHPGCEKDERELRKQCADLIETDLVPVRIFIMTELPLTLNGKIDKRALIAS
jgi:acyl-CoA synthetase (AMP-forming)/AMP-acid ligase II